MAKIVAVDVSVNCAPYFTTVSKSDGGAGRQHHPRLPTLNVEKNRTPRKAADSE